MANDTRTIGEKLRAMEEQAASKSARVPPNRAENNRPTEESHENAGGISNRPLSEERQRQENVPPRGKSKGDSHA